MNEIDIRKQIIEELHKPSRKRFPRRRTIVKGLDDLWQADLADMSAHAKSNKNHKYILIVVDCFSKYLWTRALKTKTGKDVRIALSSIFSEDKRIPKNFQTDAGKEFYNVELKKLLDKHNVNHYSTFTTMKAAMAERVIRTLKEKLQKTFLYRGNQVWINILQDVTKHYNNTKHRTIGLAPSKVNRENVDRVLNSAYTQLKIAGVGKFIVGQVVRISKHKSLFEKGYTANWSMELFKIRKVQMTNPPTYLLNDMENNPILGAFYEHELQATNFKDVYLIERILKRSKNKAYVKWLGFPSSHNSWINKNDVV